MHAGWRGGVCFCYALFVFVYVTCVCVCVKRNVCVCK